VFAGAGVFVDVGIKVGSNNCPVPQEDVNNIAIIIIEAAFNFIAPPTLSREFPTFSKRKVCLCKSAQHAFKRIA
jgi:hypothetical protein